MTNIGHEFRCKLLLAIVAFLIVSFSFVIPYPSPSAAASNPIVIENQQPGTDQWSLYKFGYPVANDVGEQIKGYASAVSVNKGDSITFYVTVNPVQSYTMDIYRIGWYQGLGGRLMQHVGPINGSPQPTCPTNATTGLSECGWAPSYTLNVPTTWTSGIYLVLLKNSQNYQNYINFAVRDDSRVADLLYQESVNTYQAYNNYPQDGTGKSLYDYNSSGANTVVGSPRAVKVSFDRPYTSAGDGGFLNWEIYFVRWLERSGYDVSYSTDIDTHANGQRLPNYKGFLSVGHDEYWSKAMYDSAVQARDSAVNIAFFGADDVGWQVRLEPSTATVVPNRVLVCYKSQTVDPVQGPTTTVRWRDPFLNRPAQGLIGIQYTAQTTNDITQTQPYVITNSSHWVYVGTGFHDGDRVPYVVGYEVDRFTSAYPPPVYQSGTYTLLSQSPVVDLYHGADYANSSIYQAPSGAWVFGAGTISWGWALDKAGVVDTRMQQTTANILNRFISGNITAPNAPSMLAATAVSTSQINLAWTDNSTNETSLVVERALTSSFSSITSFRLPAGTTIFSDTGLAAGTTYYYRMKAINAGGSSPYSNVANATTQGSPPPVATSFTIWPSTATPAVLDVGPDSAVELGVWFRADVNGTITGLRFYKSTGNTGVHVGNLWTSSSALLATATFTNETASGWQQVNFANPVAITANTLYVASYHSTIGHYSVTNNSFAGSGVDNSPLHVPANSTGTPNGPYYYGATSGFPVSTYLSSNYWVDIVFSTSVSIPTNPLVITTTSLSSGTVSVAYSQTLSASGGTSPYNWSLSSGSLPSGLGLSSNGAISGTPTSAGTSSFTVQVRDAAGITASAPLSVTIAPAYYTIWPSTATPAVLDVGPDSAVELGVSFRADVNGTITGLRFYKSTGNTGVHVGNLWTSSGVLLATATFTNETASGWQQVNFANPVAITANTLYVASYHSTVGHYSVTNNSFAGSGVDNPPLHVPANSTGTPNGPYYYGATSGFPVNTYLSSNYWVDVVFTK